MLSKTKAIGHRTSFFLGAFLTLALVVGVLSPSVLANNTDSIPNADSAPRVDATVKSVDAFRLPPSPPNPNRVAPGSNATSSTPRSSFSRGDRSSSSSLTGSEALMIMKGGRSFDFVKRKWVYVPPFSGIKRENFMWSLIVKRKMVGSSYKEFSNQMYSK